MPQIVIVNVTQATAPTPNLLQQKGAIVSLGGTTLAAGSYSLLTSSASLASLLAAPAAITSLTWSGGVVTATTAAPHGIPLTATGYSVSVTGAVPVQYNGTYTVTAVPSTTEFEFALAANPGVETTPGLWQPGSSVELQAMNTVFWTGGTNVAAYVLELGSLDPTAGVAALQTWMTANPLVFYSYLLPAGMGEIAYAPLQTLASDYAATTSKQYFFPTISAATYTNWEGVTTKSLFVTAPSPEEPVNGLQNSYFAAASAFRTTIAYNPSSTNQITPTCYSYGYGVVPWSATDNQATVTTLLNNNINLYMTGAEGGISNAILEYGTTMDGNDFTYWYSIDWVQIQSKLALANAIIVGSNNPAAPLYYNQNGINYLQAVEVGVMKRAITDGIALGTLVSTQLDQATFENNVQTGVYNGQVVVNCVPFSTYVAANPSQYDAGIYGGMSVAYTPNRGFKQVILNIDVEQFA